MSFEQRVAEAEGALGLGVGETALAVSVQPFAESTLPRALSRAQSRARRVSVNAAGPADSEKKLLFGGPRSAPRASVGRLAPPLPLWTYLPATKGEASIEQKLSSAPL